jgi:hypothetical protein
MMKVYADPASGITKGQFKRPASGLDMTLDCSRHESDSLMMQEEEPWDIDN